MIFARRKILGYTVFNNVVKDLGRVETDLDRILGGGNPVL